MRERIGTYLRVYGTLARWMWRTHKGRVSACVVASVLGVAVQAGAIAMLFVYAVSRSKGEAPTGRWAVLPFDESLGVAALWAGIGVVLGVAGGAIELWSETQAYRIGSGTMRAMGGAVLRRRGRPGAPDPEDLGAGLESRSVEIIMRRDMMMGIRMVMVLLRVVRPAVILVSASAVMVWLRWELALGVAVFSGVMLVPFYVFGRRLVRAQGVYDGLSTATGSRISAAARSMIAGGMDERGADRLAREFEEDEGLDAFMKSFGDVVLAQNRAGAGQQMIFMVAIAAVLVVYVDLIGMGVATWVGLIGFLGAMRVATGSMRSLVQRVTATGRGFPSVKRIVGMLGDSGVGVGAQGGGGGMTLPVRVGDVSIGPGCAVVVSGGRAPMGVGVSAWVRSVMGVSGSRAQRIAERAVVCASPSSWIASRGVEMLGMLRGTARGREALAVVGVGDGVTGEDVVREGEAFADPELAARIALAWAAGSDAELIVVARGTMKKLSDEEWLAWLSMVGDRAVVVHEPDAGRKVPGWATGSIELGVLEGARGCAEAEGGVEEMML